MDTYRYTLERYDSSKHNRYDCPSCGRKKCFTRYIDTETGLHINSTCGRCDHEQSCGYHYKPSDYFRDHPEMKPSDWKEKHNSVLYKNPTISQQKVSSLSSFQKQKPIDENLNCLDRMWLEKCSSEHSVLVKFLLDRLPYEGVNEAFRRYYIGATMTGGTIFWQQDIEGRLRTGKIMYYKPDGHRFADNVEYGKSLGLADPSKAPWPIQWVHTEMKKKELLPKDWQLRQCLFGEHLLPYFPEANVVMVESEKTAIIGTALHPEYVWLATGGCGLFKADNLAPLIGRRVVVIPDSGKYEEWSKVLNQTSGIHYSISDRMEKYPPNTDLADVLFGLISRQSRGHQSRGQTP